MVEVRMQPPDGALVFVPRHRLEEVPPGQGQDDELEAHSLGPKRAQSSSRTCSHGMGGSN